MVHKYLPKNVGLSHEQLSLEYFWTMTSKYDIILQLVSTRAAQQFLIWGVQKIFLTPPPLAYLGWT